jgi:hypothetical protein
MPEASEFQFFWNTLPRALALLIAIVVMVWFPAWWNLTPRPFPSEKGRLLKNVIPTREWYTIVVENLMEILEGGGDGGKIIFPFLFTKDDLP